MNLRRFCLLLLPLLLLLASGLGLGCFSETNDDLTIVALLRGTSAAAPVADLHLYFHGYAALWSRLYTAFAGVPWYALSLYTLLYAATVLTFSVLERLMRPRVPLGQVLAFLGLFFAVAWLEHGFWFNYVRVPVLLAGAGVLFAAQRAPARWALAIGLVAFGLAWLIRPSAAVLGLVAAAPGAWWLAHRQGFPVVAGAAGWAVLGALWLNLTWSPQEAAFRRLDVLKSNINDFQLSHPQPRTAPDSLALTEVQHWMLSDSTLVNETLFARVAPFDAAYFLQHIAPAKLAVLLQQLGRNYFPMLLTLLIVAYEVSRLPKASPKREFWLVQAGFAMLLLLLGVGLKLPPRLALPLLDFWLLGGLVYLWQRGQLGHSLGRISVFLLLAAVPYGYKTWHRRALLTQERHANEARRRYILGPAGAAPVVVSDAVELTYKSGSPFADPALRRPVQVMSLMGWQTLDPSQAAWRQHLTGTRDFTLALQRLATNRTVRWMLTPAGAALLNQHLLRTHNAGTPLVQLLPKALPASGLSVVQEYVAEVK